MAKRSYSVEDKLARREAILRVAAGLFMEGRGEMPTVSRVAAAAGLAKGTVYLYFRTKEEIFASVLQEGWNDALDLLETTFRMPDIAGDAKIATFIARFADHVDVHAELLRLDALGYGVLMRNVEPAALLAFKEAAYQRLETAAAAVDEALGLPSGRGVQLLTRTYGMTRGLWQSYDETIESGMDASAKYAGGFGGELREALAEYWKGAMASHRAGRLGDKESDPRPF